MSTLNKTTPQTFQAAYETLKNHADELQNSDEPDIDNLMDIVEQSIEAYKVCQTRINAVQKALDEAFADETLIPKNSGKVE